MAFPPYFVSLFTLGVNVFMSFRQAAASFMVATGVRRLSVHLTHNCN